MKDTIKRLEEFLSLEHLIIFNVLFFLALKLAIPFSLPQFASISKLPDRRLLLTATASSGTPFRLWTSTNIATPMQSWTVLTNGAFGVDGTYSYTDGPPAAVQGFYRLSVP